MGQCDSGRGPQRGAKAQDFTPGHFAVRILDHPRKQRTTSMADDAIHGHPCNIESRCPIFYPTKFMLDMKCGSRENVSDERDTVQCNRQRITPVVVCPSGCLSLITSDKDGGRGYLFLGVK